MRAQPGVFGAQIENAFLGADGLAGNRHAREDEIGKVGQDQPVLEGSRLAFVGIADDVFGVARFRAREFPLHPRRKAGAAAPAQPGGADLRDQRVRIHGLGQLQAGVRGRPREGKFVAYKTVYGLHVHFALFCQALLTRPSDAALRR